MTELMQGIAYSATMLDSQALPELRPMRSMSLTPMQENFVEKLRYQMRRRDLGTSAIGAHFNIRPQSVDGWLKTGRVSKERLTGLAELFGTSLEYWLSICPPDSEPGAAHLAARAGAGESNGPPRRVRERTPACEATPSDDGETHPIPGFTLLDESTGLVTISRYETGGSMGHGVVLHDQPGVIESWQVSREWLQANVRGYTSAANLCIVTGFGDSMRPTYNPGDPLIVDRGVTNVPYDSIYFFRVGEEGYVKRLQRVPTSDGLIYRAISDNPMYPPFDIDPTMDFEVLARVVQVWRREDY